MPSTRPPRPHANFPASHSYRAIWVWLAGLLVALVGWLAHRPALSAALVFDDGLAIVENPSIRQLADWRSVLSPPNGGSGVAGRPLVNLSLALNYAQGGLDPRPYHAFNLAAHVLVGLLLFGFCRRLFLLPSLLEDWRRAALPLALGLAALWVVHPLQTESLGSAIQRTEILGGLFYLLVLYAFVRSLEGPGRRIWMAVAWLSAVAGMASKEIMVTAPLMVLLCDRALVAGTFAEAWRRRSRFYLMLASSWLMLAFLLYRMGGTRGEGAGFGAGGVVWWTYFLKQWEALTHYLWLSGWPHPLVGDYGTDLIKALGQVWGRGLLLTVGALATLWGLWRNAKWALAPAFFFLLLGPSSSVMPLPGQTMAEHRMYLPLASVLLLGVLAGWRLLGSRWLWSGALAVVALGAVSHAHYREYRSTLHFWWHTLQVRPGNPRAHHNMGNALLDLGRNAEAGPYFARAIELEPGYVPPRIGLGNVLFRLGRYAEAVQHFQAGLVLDPTSIEGLSNLGAALTILGRSEEGMQVLQRAVHVRPSFANAHFNLGTAYLAQGDYVRAEPCFRTAITLQPAHVEARNNLAAALINLGRLNEAEEQAVESLRLRPGYQDALNNLAAIRARR